MVEVSSDEEMENEGPRALRSPLWRRRTKKTTNESKRPPRRRRRTTTTRCGTWAVPRRSPTRRRRLRRGRRRGRRRRRRRRRRASSSDGRRRRRRREIERARASFVRITPGRVLFPRLVVRSVASRRRDAVVAADSRARRLAPLSRGVAPFVSARTSADADERARPPRPIGVCKKRKGRSAPAASVRRVRFDDDAPGGRLTSIVPASAGKRRRLLAPAPGSSGKRRGRPPSFEKKRPSPFR